MDSLGISDLARLYDFFGEDDDIHEFVLTPREETLPDDELDLQRHFIDLQREVASITTEFGSDHLAQRVFRTVSVLRKLISRNVQVERQIQRSGTAVQDALEAQDEVLQLKRDYTFQTDYWDHKVQEAGPKRLRNSSLSGGLPTADAGA